MSAETWADDEGALAFLRLLKNKRASALDLLVSVASKSTDPSVRQAWGSMMQLDQVINDMEFERGKPTD